jgi:multiple sugar transport system ATP-binding protein
MAEIKLENVTKVYEKGVRAVSGVDLVVADREFAVLLGPSGCGKTTILRMIAGLEDMSEGHIYVNGTLVDDVPPHKRDIAMVFQNYALYPHMTVYDNMAFGLRMRNYRQTDIEDMVMKAADILGIRDLLKRKPRQLSGGQRQRVALGRAIVRQPKLFLFDEPLSNLDAGLRIQMRTEISRLHKKLDATVIYVTHDQVEAMTLGEKIIVLSGGEVQQIGGPRDIYHRPDNRFVAGFIGTPPMNFFRGKVAVRDGAVILSNHSCAMALDVKYKKYLGEELIVGIRPADFSFDAAGTLVPIMVEMIEPVGGETYVYGKYGDALFQARVPEGCVPQVARELQLRISPDRLYIFDGKSEKALRA